MQEQAATDHLYGDMEELLTVPRDYSFKLNKKVVRKSKLMALVDKINDSRLLIVSGFNFDKPSTKEAYNVLKSLKINENKVLVVIDDLEGSEVLSFRNLPNVLLTSYKSINTYELLVSDFVLFTKSSFEKMLKELSNARS